MPLAHPDIDWTGGDNPQSPADPLADATTIQPLILHWDRNSIAFPSATAVAPDAAIGFATAS